MKYFLIALNAFIIITQCHEICQKDNWMQSTNDNEDNLMKLEPLEAEWVDKNKLIFIESSGKKMIFE